MPITRNQLFCSTLLGIAFMLTISALYYRNVISVPTIITHTRWTFSVASRDVTCTCSQSKNRKNVSTPDVWFSTFLLALVPVRPSDKDSRQLIRDTWFEGLNNTQDAALRFIVGTKGIESDEQVKLTEENGTFGDIIFVDIKEEFNALTNKTLALINWAHHHVNFSYLLKFDDDTFVFVKNMIIELKKRPTTTKLYYGVMRPKSKPYRGNVKWADNDWNLGEHYLPFALGGGYILSHDLVSSLSEQSPRLMWHINEDTAIGAWVSALDHERKSDNRLCCWFKGHPDRTCKYPILAVLLYAHQREEIIKHFNYFHEHSNDSKTIMKYISSRSNN